MFDPASLAESLLPPQYKRPDGTIVTGRLLSIEEYAPFVPEWDAWLDGPKKGDYVALLDLSKKYLPAIFPDSPTVVQEILTSPFLMEAMLDFLHSQVVAMAGKTIAEASQTLGTTSEKSQ